MLVAALLAASVAAAWPGVALGAKLSRAISEPSPDGTGPAKHALLVAGGRQVEIVGVPHSRCEGSSGRLQIRATLSQASTRAFGEGSLDVACPPGAPVPAGPLVVREPSGVPAFTTGTARGALTYESSHSQWVGNLDLVTALPARNPLAPELGKGSSGGVRVRYAVLIGLGGLVLGLLGGLAVGRRRKAPAGA